MKGRTVTEADVIAFAGLTGDYHPQHVDAEWAAQSPFGERIAHGLLVLSLAAGMVDFDPEDVIALRRVRDVVFKRPVKLGDTIRVAAERGAPAPTGIAQVTLRITANGKLVARAVLDVVVAVTSPEGPSLRAPKGETPMEPFESLCVPL
jgi:3-hydroxybutyryl-CoA dehydratase